MKKAVIPNLSIALFVSCPLFICDDLFVLSFCFYRIILQVDKSPFVCITCTINICGIFEPNVVSKIHLFTLKWFIVFPFKSNKIIFCIISSDCTISRLLFVFMVIPSFFMWKKFLKSVLFLSCDPLFYAIIM